MRRTKFISNDYLSDYKTHLISLHILPLMMQLELNDLHFFLKCIKDATSPFNFSQYVCFTSSSTRSSAHHKLKHTLDLSRTNFTRYFYFNRLPRLWNSLPPLDPSLSLLTIKNKLNNFSGVISLRIPILPIPVPSSMCPCCHCSTLYHSQLQPLCSFSINRKLLASGMSSTQSISTAPFFVLPPHSPLYLTFPVL